MKYEEEKRLVAEGLKELRDLLPTEFRMRAWPDITFRISPNDFSHFYSEYSGGVQIVLQSHHPEHGWQDFGRNTPEFIRKEARQ